MTSFYKLSGAGNDFIVLLEPAADPSREAIRAWCRRGLSLGADGVIVLRRREEGIVSMSHWNADGGRSELCLNGSRCATRLAVELGWDQHGRIDLETDAGLLDCRRKGEDSVEIALPFEIGKPQALGLETATGEVDSHLLSVGVPHLVIFTEQDPSEIDLATIGPPLRRHARLGAAGANVNIVRCASRSEISLRTWERGVEGETLACGTGTIAAAFVGSELGLLDLPISASNIGGHELIVGRWHGRMTLAGDARLVAKGELLSGSG